MILSKSSTISIFIISLFFFVNSIFAFDSIVVFGDSYSDNGSGTYKASDGAFPPSPPYFEGRFSNGPVWAEYLSDKLGLDTLYYAAGGATTNSLFVASASGFNDEITVPGLRQQINKYVEYAHLKGGIDSKTNKILYVVSMFGADYIYSIKHGPKVASPEQVIGQIITNLQTLYIDLGASNFLVATLPDLGKFPGFSKSNQSEKEFLSNLSKHHNTLLRQALDVLKRDFKRVKTYVFDTDSFFESFDSSVNAKDPCLTINYHGPHACENPEDFLFWDNLHLTTSAHESLASEAFKILPKS